MCSDLDSKRLIVVCNRLYKFRGPKTARSSFRWEVWWWKCGQIPALKQDRKRARKPHWKEMVRSNRELRGTETWGHIPLPSQVFSRNWTICSLIELEVLCVWKVISLIKNASPLGKASVSLCSPGAQPSEIPWGRITCLLPLMFLLDFLASFCFGDALNPPSPLLSQTPSEPHSFQVMF